MFAGHVEYTTCSGLLQLMELDEDPDTTCCHQASVSVQSGCHDDDDEFACHDDIASNPDKLDLRRCQLLRLRLDTETAANKNVSL